MSADARRPWIVGVTGASGTPYAAAVLKGLFDADLPVDLVVSRAARLTLLDETGIEGELAVREVRTGRAEVVQMWGRTESVREEFRQLRAQ